MTLPQWMALLVGKSRHFLTGKGYIGLMRILGFLLLVFAGFFFMMPLFFLKYHRIGWREIKCAF